MNRDGIDKPLASKTALVTGGSRGVGAVTARMLAEAGADVAVNYRDKRKRVEQVVAEVTSPISTASNRSCPSTNRSRSARKLAKWRCGR
ncbi:hypothetical protein BH20CHL3_BH20CHL3_01880 [soil metagenome]